MQTNDFSNLPFSQCISKISIKHKIKQKDYLANGKYPVIDQGQSFISGYCDDEIAIKIKKPVIIFGDHTRCFKFVDFNFVAGADGIHILEPKDFFNEKLFYYFCLALDFPNKGYSRHFQYLAKTTMKIPPLEIQKRIVARLESAFEKIEKGSAHLQDAKTKLAKYKQSLLKSAFDGTLFCHTEGEARSILNQESRDISLTLNMTNSLSLRASVASVAIQNNDTTKALDCHSPNGLRNDSTHSSLRESSADEAIHKVDCHDLTSSKLAMTDKENPKLPQGWTIKTLGEICEINPKNKLNDDLEVSFIPMNLILDKFQNKFSYETKIWKNIKKGYTHFQNNCIALAKITPCFENGKCVILDNLKNGYGAGTTELIILLPNLSETIAKYIFYFLNTQNFIEQGKRNFKGTAGQLRISADFVANCKIPLPPLETQKQIVKLLEKHLQHADKTGEFIESALNKAKQLKQSLLKSAFLGKLT